MAKTKWIDEHIGETRANNAGIKMTITDGINSTNIEVTFEDGSIAEHRKYGEFKRGAIEHPKGNFFYKCINETRMNNAGLKMTITDINNKKDIEITFEDGSVAKHKSYQDFKNGYIKHPKGNFYAKHIGETRTNTAGFKMTITDANTANDIEITFDDGSIVEHRTYYNFKRGSIAHPIDDFYKKYINETRMNSAGLKMTITNIISPSNIEVTFDDGSIAKHKTYNDFAKGHIRHPKGNFYVNHIGETQKNNYNNLNMTITDGKISTDIEITFEDGTIVKHATYSSFINGSVKHPNRFYVKHINEIRSNTTGRKMKITDINTPDDIEITFDDGTIIKHKAYSTFKKGYVMHPNDQFYIKHMNETTFNNQNMKMTITNIITSHDIELTFEDGSVVRHKPYKSIKNKHIPHPLYNNKTSKIGCITRKKLAYKTDLCHYYCTCNICGKSDIWNWKEIHAHNALHGIPKEDLIYMEPDKPTPEETSETI